MRQWTAKAFLVLGGLIVSLVLVEVLLRLLGIGYPHFYGYDPHLGSRLRPGIKGYWLKEGGGYVSINRDGLRDREHALLPPPDTLRIAILGDSFAEALQVNREEAFWAVMEKELQDCRQSSGRKVEVINFGQSGFGTTQEFLALQHRAWKYQPDIILLAFFTGNDVADNSRALKQKDYHPYQVYRHGELHLEDQGVRENRREDERNWSWGRKFHQWRLDNFRVEQVVHLGRKRAWEWWERQRAREQPGAAPPGGGSGNSDAIYREPGEDTWKEAWKVTEGVLLLMRDEIRRKKARFFVVVLTNDIQVHPDASRRARFAQRLGVDDLFYPDRRVAGLCRREGIPVLLLGPPFQADATSRQVFFHGFKDNPGWGHWNQQGHRLAGEMLATWLCGQLN